MIKYDMKWLETLVMIWHNGPRFEVIWETMRLSGNTEEGKCQLTNEYPFFLFFDWPLVL